MVGDYESAVQNIEHQGIPYGSPLSPILDVLYNAALVLGQVNQTEASTGFIDDYHAWVTCASVIENTRRLQAQLLPRAES